MKIDKDVPMDRKLIRYRINVFFLFVLWGASLFFLYPVRSFGQSGFSEIPVAPAALFAASPADTSPVKQSQMELPSPPSEQSPMNSFTSSPPKTPTEPAPIDFSSPTSDLSLISATPNSPIASSAAPIVPNAPPTLTSVPTTPSMVDPSQRPPKIQKRVPAQTSVSMPNPASVPSTAPALSSIATILPTTHKEPTTKELQERPELLRSVTDPNHPFARYFDLPKNLNSMIKGKPYTIAQLLDGTVPGSRSQLLQVYWELAGLLTEYNFRCEVERMIGTTPDAQQNLVMNLFQQQRRSTEIEFVKKQWQLSELIKRTKGSALSDGDLPIPCDYPLFKRYETYVDKIARTDRTRYLGHLIPIQEQLIDAKQRCCLVMFEMFQNAPLDSRRLDVLNQRTEIFLDLVETVIDYNKMIAEYTAETISSNVTGYRLVGALIELPKLNSGVPIPNNPQPTEQATPATLKLGEISSPAEFPQATFAPQPLPIGRRPFPPINQPVVQASYVEE